MNWIDRAQGRDQWRENDNEPSGSIRSREVLE
jgi:hypothetical protein